MSIDLDPRPEESAAVRAAVVRPERGPLTDDTEDAVEASPGRTALVGVLSSSGAGFLIGGMFSGQLGRLVGVASAVVAGGLVALAVVRGRVWLQYLVAPAIFVLGYLTALVLPNPTGVTGTVPSLVRQAIRNGGLDHPPLPFDPGWRFLVAAIVGLVSAAAVSLACGFRRPRLAVLIPLPLLLAAALNQAPGRELIGGAVGLALLLAALSVSSGAELAGSAQVSRTYELRQAGKALAATAACLLALAALSRATFLFPAPPPSSDAKPQKPQVVPLSKVPDRPLFSVQSASLGPFRVGVLDSYADDSWFLPPFDPDRYVTLPADGRVDPPAPGAPVRTVFVISGLSGFTLPTAPQARAATAEAALQYDPRVAVFRTKEGAPAVGFRVTQESGATPTGAQLRAAAGRATDPALTTYTTAPSLPPEIQRLLVKAPAGRWEKLQALRAALYKNVVAAGSGVPVDVPATRVPALVAGGKATPYEIVAAEALLARWAGLPSRIGYGYYGGTLAKGTREFRPRDGANWLEVHLPDYGWVPIVGTPRQAQASLDEQEANNRPRVVPSNRIAIQVFIPVLNPDPQLLFEIVRYWVARVIPVLLALFLAWRLVPACARALRRRRRRQWALAHGPAGRIAVAYAEFRDSAADLSLDNGRATPIEYLDEVQEDDEHRELAWLTTRALWGDLARDLRDDDASAAQALSRSLVARMARGQSGLVRLAAVSNRASLRTPYDVGLPNVWPRFRRRLPALGRP